jgi:hypothetical protein
VRALGRFRGGEATVVELDPSNASNLMAMRSIPFLLCLRALACRKSNFRCGACKRLGCIAVHAITFGKS